MPSDIALQGSEFLLGHPQMVADFMKERFAQLPTQFTTVSCVPGNVRAEEENLWREDKAPEERLTAAGNSDIKPKDIRRDVPCVLQNLAGGDILDVDNRPINSPFDPRRQLFQDLSNKGLYLIVRKPRAPLMTSVHRGLTLWKDFFLPRAKVFSQVFPLP